MVNESDSTQKQARGGYVALIGRPNVGKSTLLNRLIGQKIAITTHKPQTTRHRILGINTLDRKDGAQDQIVYVDTPGIHLNAKKAMNKYMNRTASSTVADVDVVLFVVDATRWTEEDEFVLEKLKDARATPVLVINKIDMLDDKDKLLPLIQNITGKADFAAVIPLSARKEKDMGVLEREILPLLPYGDMMFPEDQVTDRSQRFLAAELIREKLMKVLHQELPYSLTVEIEKFDYDAEDDRYEIAAVIWAERDSQKAIIIGKQGKTLKMVGTNARQDMQRLFEQRVHLQLWVKVKEGWSDDERALSSLGYDEL